MHKSRAKYTIFNANNGGHYTHLFKRLISFGFERSNNKTVGERKIEENDRLDRFDLSIAPRNSNGGICNFSRIFLMYMSEADVRLRLEIIHLIELNRARMHCSGPITERNHINPIDWRSHSKGDLARQIKRFQFWKIQLESIFSSSVTSTLSTFDHCVRAKVRCIQTQEYEAHFPNTKFSFFTRERCRQ